jgi:hypothetical protein
LTTPLPHDGYYRYAYTSFRSVMVAGSDLRLDVGKMLFPAAIASRKPTHKTVDLITSAHGMP